jgi:hypothetical protein
MPVAKEFVVTLEDRPGTLGKLCYALSDQRVNITAFESVPFEGKGLVRFMVDKPTVTQKILHGEGLSYKEAEVAQARFLHRPGELARVALQLGEAGINVNYAYTGVDPNTNTPFLVFGVDQVTSAAAILDRIADTPKY